MTAVDTADLRRALIEQRLRRPAPDRDRTAAPIGRRADRGGSPLSASQRQLWYLAQLAPSSTAYNELAIITKAGPCDTESLAGAVGDVVARHEAWRTTFHAGDDGPVQVVHPPAALDVPVVDLSRLPADQADRRAAELAAQRLRQPFDLTGALLRPWIVRLSETEHRLYLALHHLIFDGVTLYRVLLPELQALYRARVTGEPSGLPEPAVQYPDYALWELDWLEQDEVRASVDWWRRELAGARPAGLPLDYDRPAQRSFRGGAVALRFAPAELEPLRSCAREAGGTLFHGLAAVYSRWLRDWTGDPNPTFGTVTDLRRRPELAGMAGYCLAPLPVRVDLTAAPTLLDLIRQLRATVVSAMSHPVPFEVLVRELGVPRDPRANPLFQTSFVLEPPASAPASEWSLRVMDDAVGELFAPAKFDLSVELDERPDGEVTGRLLYDAELFDAATAGQMAEHFRRLVRGTGDRSPRAEPAGRARPVGQTDRTVADIVQARVHAHPGAPAVLAGGRQLSYAELYERATRTARRLRAAGARPGTVVATALDRSVDSVTGLLAVVLSGAAFLPLDVEQPLRRLDFMVQDADARLVLTNQPPETIPDLGLPVISLHSRHAPDGREPLPAARPDDPAYVIYTSGSTGRPKGVLVEHRNLVHLMSALFQTLGVAAGDTVVSVANHVFDMAIGDIFCTVAVGGRVAVATREETADPRLLARLLDRSDAAMLRATPTAWQALVHSGWAGSPSLTAVSGGEPLPDGTAHALLQRCRAVFNGYGPTETTVVASVGRVQAGQPVSAGRPVGATVVRIADRAGAPVAPGLPGEVLIAGPGVARGYLRLPVETRRQFVPDPDAPGGRWYRTGDRGRLLADGSLRLLGRIDEQVKVRGFRIEPGEIESALNGHPAVAASAVTVQPDGTGAPSLVAHVVDDGTPAPDADLRGWLRARVPDYMVPNRITRIDALPQTPAGKVDRAALAARPVEVGTAPATPARSRTETERRLAELWAGLLGEAEVDPDADFFDLGGHSLLAVRMVARVRAEYGVDLPVARFLRDGRTVAGLARLLERDARGPASRPARRPAKPADPARPSVGRAESSARRVFLLYPDGPSALSARHFAAEWGGRVTVVPLHPHLTHGRFERGASVESLAADLLWDLRAQQPQGPYLLAGYSFGGILAYEIGRQLAAAGQDVQWLAVIDTPSNALAERELRRSFALKNRLTRFAGMTPRARADKLREATQRGWRRQLVDAGLAEAGAPDFDVRAALEMVARYDGEGSAVPVDLVVTDDSAAALADDSLGWDGVHRGVLRVHRLPGNHSDVLRPPLVERLAGLLSQTLDEALSAPAR